MSFLRAEPSKTNMHTCKDEPFRTTPTSVLLMKPMNSRSFLCTGFLGVWRLSVQNFGGQTDLGTRSVDVRGLSSIDVRGFMPGQLSENRSVSMLKRCPTSPRTHWTFFFQKKQKSQLDVSVLVVHRISALTLTQVCGGIE